MKNPSTESPTQNSAQCIPCPNGTLSTGAQTVDQSVCNSCAINYYMAQSSIAASQNNNNQGVAAQCLVCPLGSGNLEVSNVQGDISQCSICLENYFMVSPAIQSSKGIQSSAAQCLPCPSNSYNPKNSQQGYCTCYDQNATPLSSQVQSCNCKNGYSGYVATSQNAPSGCFPCPQGFYSNSSTSYKCILCPSGSYINNDQSNCICNDNSLAVYFDPRSQSCKCQKDYFGNPSQATLNTIGSCTPCPKKLKMSQFQNEIMKSQCIFYTFQNLVSFSLILATIQLCILL
ncbi:glutathione S-transferase, amine-terminal domain protein (macronuclear) [Tetrahymena thermophila SB210]|uniref:Glutathione S-transferase, amine-terminal domain protein n=1 Tax=Tetrahymena thermophila (strain SB210) TaxID=312017 RepID=W7XGM1_TETTS|nr:glutathione S-transferase, amine-terminal domain protein [Tetrahymena thermophila SB210]EWS76188.1 glutathione S-transferase, amine-terminal domain protein [Tetrahymena thermophila SB210]|eukprot:XP_012651235.1 glutathione S-transferase, amine-terminal domain protein [Tetrahymena thermophila SB210]